MPFILQTSTMEVSQESFKNVEEMSKKDYPPNVITSIKNIVERCNFKKYTVNIKLISTGGGSYLGKVYFLDIFDDYSANNIRAFVKSIVPYEDEVFMIRKAYKNEELFYKDISKTFTKIQEEANVPESERFKFATSLEETNADTVILENIALKGFKTFERLGVVNLDTAEICIKFLAKFHALSFAVEKKMPEYFEEIIKPTSQPFIYKEPYFQTLRNFIKMALRHLNDDTKVRAEKILDDVREAKGLMAESSGIKCLTHGDYRLGNILFKENNGVIEEILAVDYQLISYSSPINDFLFFIILGTSREFRRNHLEHLKELYYETLGNFLKYFDLNVKNIYPKVQFEVDYKRQLKVGLFYALQFLHFVLADENDVPEMDSLADNMSIAVDKCYPERLQGIIDDYIEWGIL